MPSPCPICHHHQPPPARPVHFILGFGLASIIIALLIYFDADRLLADPNLTTTSSVLTLALFGFFASVSHCAIFVGGLVTLLTKLTADTKQFWLTVASFHLGRILSYTFFGGLLGFLGTIIAINVTFTAVVMLLVSLLMIIVGLNFLGLPIIPDTHDHRFFQRLAKSHRLTLLWIAFIGASTFFIPCAFTSTVQLLALQAASPWQSALMMLAFVLGTLPVLLLISFTGRHLRQRPHLHHVLNYTLGFLIIFFAFFTLNNQLALLGFPHLAFLVHHH